MTHIFSMQWSVCLCVCTFTRHTSTPPPQTSSVSVSLCTVSHRACLLFSLLWSRKRKLIVWLCVGTKQWSDLPPDYHSPNNKLSHEHRNMWQMAQQCYSPRSCTFPSGHFKDCHQSYAGQLWSQAERDHWFIFSAEDPRVLVHTKQHWPKPGTRLSTLYRESKYKQPALLMENNPNWGF